MTIRVGVADIPQLPLIDIEYSVTIDVEEHPTGYGFTSTITYSYIPTGYAFIDNYIKSKGHHFYNDIVNEDITHEHVNTTSNVYNIFNTLTRG